MNDQRDQAATGTQTEAEEPPGGPYCACADPDCPTPDDQYTHG